jgi:EpsI family protein
MSDKMRFGCLIALLLVATVDLRGLSHGHPVSAPAVLATFPEQLDGWSGRNLPEIDDSVKKVLRADDYLLRDYRGDDGSAPVGLFIVYYSSQRSGDALHSPKNCLPGAGWQTISSDVIRISNPAAPDSGFDANHYVIQKDGTQQDVLYWYQSRGRIFASEYLGKVYLAWDGITKGRTDGALIRLTAVRTSGDTKTFPAMVALAEKMSLILPRFLPS